MCEGRPLPRNASITPSSPSLPHTTSSFFLTPTLSSAAHTGCGCTVTAVDRVSVVVASRAALRERSAVVDCVCVGAAAALGSARVLVHGCDMND